jgi:hypothetical protein
MDDVHRVIIHVHSDKISDNRRGGDRVAEDPDVAINVTASEAAFLASIAVGVATLLDGKDILFDPRTRLTDDQFTVVTGHAAKPMSYNRNLWMRHLNEGATYLPV